MSPAMVSSNNFYYPNITILYRLQAMKHLMGLAHKKSLKVILHQSLNSIV